MVVASAACDWRRPMLYCTPLRCCLPLPEWDTAGGMKPLVVHVLAVGLVLGLSSDSCDVLPCAPAGSGDLDG